MDLHDRAVQAHRFDLGADNLLFLHLFEQLIQHAGFGPTVHADTRGRHDGTQAPLGGGFAESSCFVMSRPCRVEPPAKIGKP
jgi:hypothetical protein